METELFSPGVKKKKLQICSDALMSVLQPLHTHHEHIQYVTTTNRLSRVHKKTNIRLAVYVVFLNK